MAGTHTLARAGLPIDARTAAMLGQARLTDDDLLPAHEAVAILLRAAGLAGARDLVAVADLLDGGRGVHVHHECPDETFPTSECDECTLVGSCEFDSDRFPIPLALAAIPRAN